MWQGIIVAAIICVAIIYLVRRQYRSLRSKDPCCGCEGCSGAKPQDSCCSIGDLREPDSQEQPHDQESPEK